MGITFQSCLFQNVTAGVPNICIFHFFIYIIFFGFLPLLAVSCEEADRKYGKMERGFNMK